MSRKKPAGKILLSGVLFCSILLSGCSDDPAFSGMIDLGSKPYVAYKTNDGYEKPDTLTISFDYNPSKITSILVEATLDSGITWLPVAALTPKSSGRATVRWVPKDADSATRNFFGFKTGSLRITDPGSGEAIESAPFALIGALPLKLIKPRGGETYGMNDSIIVEYSANMDLLARILAFFKTDSMSNWEEFFDADTLPGSRGPIENWKKWFVPAELDSAVKVSAGNFEQPIQILLQDYSNDLAVEKTGYITITQ